MPRSLTFIGRSLAIAALGTLLTAIVLEVWARTQPRRYFLEFDETLGFRAEPGSVGEYRGRWMLSPNPAIRSKVRFDSRGMRGPERELAKSPGTRRMLVLGDSFVQALEVPYGDTFYARLEKLVRDTAGPRVEAIPMGCSGYGQAQQLLWLQDAGVALDPDLVMLVVFLGNDLIDNSSELSMGTTRPFFALRGGVLEFASAPGQAARWKYRASRYLHSYVVYKEIGHRIGALRGMAAQLGVVNYAERAHSKPELARARRDAYDLTFALIREMDSVSRAAGAEVLVAFHGSYPTGSNETPQQRVAEFCRESTLNCLDIGSQLAGHDEFIVPLDEHWSSLGHQRVAELVFGHWRDELLGAETGTEPQLSPQARL